MEKKSSPLACASPRVGITNKISASAKQLLKLFGTKYWNYGEVFFEIELLARGEVVASRRVSGGGEAPKQASLVARQLLACRRGPSTQLLTHTSATRKATEAKKLARAHSERRMRALPRLVTTLLLSLVLLSHPAGSEHTSTYYACPSGCNAVTQYGVCEVRDACCVVCCSRRFMPASHHGGSSWVV